jgi:SagB-type dehydrogenase family enzyme
MTRSRMEISSTYLLELLRGVADPQVLRRTLAFHSQSNFVRDPNFGSRIGIRPLPPKTDTLLREADMRMSEAQPRPLPIRCHRACEPALRRNRSTSQFTPDRQISLETIASLLAESFGADPDDGSRPYASAGMLYPIEVFLCMFAGRVQSETETGIWHYLPGHEALEPVRTIATDDLMAVLNGYIKPQIQPAFFLVYVFQLCKSLSKYRYRGYRFGLLEAGSMYQQADLVAKALSLQTRVWAAFGDYDLAKALCLNPAYFVPLIVQAFG